MKHRGLWRLTCLAVVWCAVAPVAADGKLARKLAAKLGPLIALADANRDGLLDRDERADLETKVRREYSLGGMEALEMILAAADASGDGRVDLAEWTRAIRAIREHKLDRDTVKLRMSDGTRLATEVYKPGGEGPWPVVLIRTPYGRRMAHVQGWMPGCVIVAQDMRGRGGSEGENIPFVGCGWAPYRDGAETLAWILKQEWCNGKVVTVGGSAGGITQYMLAPVAGKHLRGQFIAVAAPSLYHYAAYSGGAFREAQVLGWLKTNRFDPRCRALFRKHPLYDEFWDRYDAQRRAGEANCPAIHVGGWFDTFLQGTIDGFRARQTEGGPGARGKQKLVIGPWTHNILLPRKRVGQMKFPDAAPPVGYTRAALLANVLLGIDNGLDARPAVAYYLMGDVSDDDAPGNQWRFSETWPIKTRDRKLYLTAGGRLGLRPPEAGDDPAWVGYTFDPANPCPTSGGCNLFLEAGPRDQRKVEARDDVLTFTTEPLSEPLAVVGRIRAVLYVECSATDTDLSVRFTDVYPNGMSMLMAEGMLRLSRRNGLDRVNPLRPGQVYKVEVELWATAVAVAAGHRIRIAVTGSNHPRFDVNPGNCKGLQPRKQNVKLHVSSRRASHVVLPVAR
jgi:hypothetical protein